MHHWGKVINDELAAITGKYEELVGRLQEKYGIAKEDAKQQVDLFRMQCSKCRLRTAEQMKKSSSKLMEMEKALSKQKEADRKPASSKLSTKKRIRSHRIRDLNASRD